MGLRLHRPGGERASFLPSERPMQAHAVDCAREDTCHRNPIRSPYLEPRVRVQREWLETVPNDVAGSRPR
jgi:hypothetical protein